MNSTTPDQLDIVKQAFRASELMILLAQGNPEKAAIPDDWKPVNQATIDSDKLSW